MLKNICTGLLAGVIIVTAGSLLLKRRGRKLSHTKSDRSEMDTLDMANHYLVLARGKVDEMNSEAVYKSNSLLEQANKLLSLAKEKTSSIDLNHAFEIDIAKDDIKKRIEQLRKEIEN